MKLSALLIQWKLITCSVQPIKFILLQNMRQPPPHKHDNKYKYKRKESSGSPSNGEGPKRRLGCSVCNNSIYNTEVRDLINLVKRTDSELSTSALKLTATPIEGNPNTSFWKLFSQNSESTPGLWNNTQVPLLACISLIWLLMKLRWNLIKRTSAWLISKSL